MGTPQLNHQEKDAEHAGNIYFQRLQIQGKMLQKQRPYPEKEEFQDSLWPASLNMQSADKIHRTQ